MTTKTTFRLASLLLLLPLTAFQQYPALSPSSAQQAGAAPIKFPEHYREWVYLTTGFDMSYNPAMQMDHHMFDNVFVNPDAYQSFLRTGTWPDHTTLVLEV